jgi:hypothetical protein
MRTLDEMKEELRTKRRLWGWYGLRLDYEMRSQLSRECYKLWTEIECLKRARTRYPGELHGPHPAWSRGALWTG